jgi:hypothetical protein
MIDFHDRLRMKTREELSLTDSAEKRAFHDSIHRYRKRNWTNERTNDSERFFLANWATRTESRKIIMKSITTEGCMTFWLDLHCFLFVGVSLTCVRLPVWLTWSNSPPRPLMTALTAVSAHGYLINTYFKNLSITMRDKSQFAGRVQSNGNAWLSRTKRDIWSPLLCPETNVYFIFDVYYKPLPAEGTVSLISNQLLILLKNDYRDCNRYEGYSSSRVC